MAAEKPSPAGKVLAVATYYLPYLSGLTVYLRRLARALQGVGWEVTVLTSRHAPALPVREVMEGVAVVRVPVLAAVSKGVLMPSLPRTLLRLGKQADLILLVLPQADAAALAWVTKKLLRRPLVVAMVCDLALEGGLGAWLLERVLRLSHRRALEQAEAIVALDADYAAASRLLSRFSSKVRIIPPPVPLPEVHEAKVQALRERWQLAPGEPVVGWVGRVSREKGLHVLAEAMPRVWEVFPHARVLCAGPVDVPGEVRYRRELAARVAPFGARWRFLGQLSSEDLAAFLRLVTVMAFPSVNRTEAFGMVQVEAMGCGTPVVASDLPGVRTPVTVTGMGLLVPPGDPQALAEALIQVLRAPGGFQRENRAALTLFAPERVAHQYAALFSALAMANLGKPRSNALECSR